MGLRVMVDPYPDIDLDLYIELMEALKEMGIEKRGHRQTIVGAVLGKL